MTKVTKMTKTQLLNELLTERKDVYSYTDIKLAFCKLTNYPEDSYTIGPWCVALYATKPYKSQSHYYAYFIRPSKDEPRYLKRIGRGRYIITDEPYEQP